MSNSEVIVKVSFPAWGVCEKSWYLLTKRSQDGKSWSGGVWIPKSVCSLEKSRKEENVGILTLPFWLYQKKSEEGVEFTNLQNKII